MECNTFLVTDKSFGSTCISNIDLIAQLKNERFCVCTDLHFVILQYFPYQLIFYPISTSRPFIINLPRISLAINLRTPPAVRVYINAGVSGRPLTHQQERQPQRVIPSAATFTSAFLFGTRFWCHFSHLFARSAVGEGGGGRGIPRSSRQMMGGLFSCCLFIIIIF